MSLKLQYEFLVLLLLAVLVLEYVGRRLRLPPAASFIIGGMMLAVLPGVPQVEINPDLIMVVFLPPLLMSGAYFTHWRSFKSQLRAIISLAFGAVIFTTACVGFVLHFLVPTLPLAICFAIGAIVSPPDAVAATAVLRKLNLPNKLLSLLEGESLINDATGLVLFGIALTAAVSGLFSVSQAVGWFTWLALIGGSAGAAMGWLGTVVIRRLRETELVITATLLLSTASYVFAESVGGSGVLATVACGLVVGWYGHDAVYAATRVRAHAFWNSLVFILESLLFILIGLSLRDVLMRLSEENAKPLLENAAPVIAVVVTVIVCRFVWLGICALSILPSAKKAKLRDSEGPDFRSLLIVGWSGMRGVVTLTAALSFPANLPGRDLVLLASFSVIVVTVLVQGATLAPLARWLNIAASGERLELEKSKMMLRSHLASGEFGTVGPFSSTSTSGAEMGTQTAEDRERFESKLRHVREAREELLDMYRRGQVHDHLLREIEYELDLEEMAAEIRLPPMAGK